MILELHKTLQANDPNIAPVAVDDMVYTIERILTAQEDFRAAGKPTTVDLGYQYTMSENLKHIQLDGLLSKHERPANKITPAKYTGSLYGEGIYTALNASAYNCAYGDVGLMVVRLRGVEADHPAGTRYDAGNDSITVFRNRHDEFIILQASKQCIPVLQFATASIVRYQPDHPGNLIVHKYHVHLQKIVDDVFNGGVPTSVSPLVRADMTMYSQPNSSMHPILGAVPAPTNLTQAPGTASVAMVPVPVAVTGPAKPTQTAGTASVAMLPLPVAVPAPTNPTQTAGTASAAMLPVPAAVTAQTNPTQTAKAASVVTLPVPVAVSALSNPTQTAGTANVAPPIGGNLSPRNCFTMTAIGSVQNHIAAAAHHVLSAALSKIRAPAPAPAVAKIAAPANAAALAKIPVPAPAPARTSAGTTGSATIHHLAPAYLVNSKQASF